MKLLVRFGAIRLPHIGYTVYIRRFGKIPDSLSERTKMYATQLDAHSSAIYTPQVIVASELAHELVHVLRYICISLDMDFVYEKEHMAYIMQYLMGRALGLEYKLEKVK